MLQGRIKHKNRFYAIDLFINLASLDFFLDAVFLWKMPLDAALSMADTAFTNAVSASARSPAATADIAFLIAVFVDDLTCLFLACFFAITSIRFFADLILAKNFTSRLAVQALMRSGFCGAARSKKTSLRKYILYK